MNGKYLLIIIYNEDEGLGFPHQYLTILCQDA